MTAIALAACGGVDGDEGDATGTTANRSESAASGEEEAILIKTRMNIPTGKILDASTIGDSPFCPGGMVKDKHGVPEIGLVDRTITCSDGTLRVGFDPQEPVGNTQTGPWRIISGTGAYEGWQGSGEMKTTYERDRDTARETFTGTVTHQLTSNSQDKSWQLNEPDKSFDSLGAGKSADQCSSNSWTVAETKVLEVYTN